MFLIWWILVGLIAGWAAGKIMKGSGFGAVGDIILGILGALVGGFLMRLLGFAGQGGIIYTILIAILGAVLLVWIMRKIKAT
ncbi:MAG TPA: GlsB/YeaQ/YmgE family stress response membrane protein [Candidatus Angelobacter sp.]